MKTTIETRASEAVHAEPPWMHALGQLKPLRSETKRIQARIDEAFAVIEPEDRA